LRNFIELLAGFEDSFEAFFGVYSKSIGVPVGMLIFFVELRLVFQASFGFFLFSRFCVADCLFHVHGICPVSFTFENKQMQKLFVLFGIIDSHNFAIKSLLHLRFGT